MTRIKDIGRVVLGAKNEDISARVDGKPTVGLIIFQLPDANALETADLIHAKMDELAKNFPDDLVYEIHYDTTPYTRECIDEVFKAPVGRDHSGGPGGAAVPAELALGRSFP